VRSRVEGERVYDDFESGINEGEDAGVEGE
jgi:hypothetical protein